MSNAYDSLILLGANVIGYEPGYKRHGKTKKEAIKKACRLAKNADVAVVFLGLEEGYDSEGRDRKDMYLPENQRKLIRMVTKYNENVVVVLSCGCIVEMSWDKKVKCVLHSYLSGQAGGAAVAQLLLGDKNPSGKLSETIPMKYEDVPSANYFPGPETTAEHREGIYVGYRYYDTAKVKVKYPFGHGLSYTKFEYGNLKAEKDKISFTIENVGERTGREVAQVYVSAKTNGMFRPEKELKGFASIVLKPGEKKEVEVKLNDRSFAVWSIEAEDWVIEPGEYEILVGASSRDIRLRDGLTIKTKLTQVCQIEKVREEKGKIVEATVENPYKGTIFRPYYNADVKNIQDETFKALIDRDIPDPRWNLSRPLEINDTIYMGRYSEKK